MESRGPRVEEVVTEASNPKVNLLEEDMERMVAELEATLESMPEAAVPFGSVKLTPDERKQRYASMREDPEAWTEMLQERGYPDTIKYARTMERQFRKASDEESE